MSEVKRYEDEMCGHGGCDMCSYEIVEDENGSWVDYADYKKLEEENRRLREEVGKLQDFTLWLWSGCFGHVENIRGDIIDIYEDWERGKFDRKKKEQGDD